MQRQEAELRVRCAALNRMTGLGMSLDFDHDLIRLENSRRQRNKSKKPRYLPMNSRAKEVLLELCRASDSEYVFPNQKTGQHIKDVKTGFRAACAAAGIDDFTFHDLRRTAATRLGTQARTLSTSRRP